MSELARTPLSTNLGLEQAGAPVAILAIPPGTDLRSEGAGAAKLVSTNRALRELSDDTGLNLLASLVDAPALARAIADSVDTPGLPQRIVVENECPAGCLRELAVEAVAAEREDEDEDQLVVITLLDLSEQKRIERELRAAVADRDRWIHELRSRVKTNFQIVSSLVYLGSQSADGDVGQLVTRTQRRIRSLALIHESLLRSPGPLEADFSHYLRELVGELPEARQVADETGGVRVEIDCRDIRLPVDVAVPCALIFEELLHNAMAHAFPADRATSPEAPTVWLSLVESPRCVRLEVRDNGVGLPTAIDPRSPKTLGLRLVRTLAGQVGGRLRLVRTRPAHLWLEIPKTRIRHRGETGDSAEDLA